MTMEIETNTTYRKDFLKWKKVALSKTDFSRKGSLDEDIFDLVNWINQHEDYFTTSSCSGRIVVCSDDDYFNKVSKTKKKSCKWYHISHSTIKDNIVVDLLSTITEPSKIKFEGFVLHVQCCSLQSAKIVHQAAVESGFRNSGITFGKNNKKIIAAVRGTACLEVPLSSPTGKILLPNETISYIIHVANEKLLHNLQQIQSFSINLKLLLKPNILTVKKSTENKKEVYRKKNKIARTKTKESDLNNTDAIEDFTALFRTDEQIE